MKIVAAGKTRAGKRKEHRHRVNLAERISQIPYHPIAMAIQMATGTRHSTVRGKRPIVKKSSTVAHCLRFGIKTDRHLGYLNLGICVHNTNGFVEAVKHVEQLPRLVDG